MSWHYSRALVAASWEASYWDGVPLVPLSVKSIHVGYSCSDRTMDALIPSLFGMTLEPSAVTTLTPQDSSKPCETFAETSLLAEVSPARTSAVPVKGAELTEKEADYGQKWSELYVKYDRATHSWKTHRCLWEEDLPESSVTLQNKGMMQGGVLWDIDTKGEIFAEIEYGYLPAPLRSLGESFLGGPIRDHETWKNVYRLDHLLIGFWKKWEARENNGRLGEKVVVHPTYTEFLMGWILCWTDLKPLEMGKYQQWRQKHSCT